MFDPKEYYLKNKDKIIKTSLKRYQENKEELKQKRRERYKKQKKNGTFKRYNWDKTKRGKEWTREYYNKYNRPLYIITNKKTIKTGLTIKDKKIMLSKQNNKCLICGKIIELKQANLDHCHKTNKIRGILCSQCNSILGFCFDNIEILKNSIKYLKKNKYNQTIQNGGGVH